MITPERFMDIILLKNYSKRKYRNLHDNIVNSICYGIGWRRRQPTTFALTYTDSIKRITVNYTYC